MIPPLDPFAQKFDSIEVDASRSREAIEHAMARVAGPAEAEPTTPGFYLLSDANGRFVVDREIGVVTLADESILQTERNSIHSARLRVIEPSGATYELEMQLRITGRVPQMIGAEEFAAIAGLTDETILVAPRVPLLIVSKEEPKTPLKITPITWTHFAVAQGHQSRTPRVQPRRGFITADVLTTNESISLEFDGLPPPFPAYLPWSL